MKRIIISLIIISAFVLPFLLGTKEILQINHTHTIQKDLENKNYYQIIEIPKINLIAKIYPTDSKENNVDKNIYLHPASDANNIILASHSGNGIHAYFDDLDQLRNDDEIFIWENGIKNTYKIVQIEEQLKTGNLYLKTFKGKMITLITCSKNSSKKQIIYYGMLKND